MSGTPERVGSRAMLAAGRRSAESVTRGEKGGDLWRPAETAAALLGVASSSATAPAVPMCTSPAPSLIPHNIMVRAFMRAAQQAAEQGVGPQHPLETHDHFLARHHAERAPRVSSGAKLTNDTSSSNASDAPSAPCGSPKPDLPSTHQHRTHGDVTG
ncbi:hypothetical protein T484DRAFT_1915982 [Baffinella frigidus]|nr:hypothetical protein T484DRAFT_1915982 [Cryptophyta sp. CCMP2293]